MRVSRRYLAAMVLLAVFAVAFGVFGTVAPPLAEEGSPVEPQQGSSSESVGHFQNPPSYDSGWVDITTKTGQYVTLNHGLNTTDVVVDVSGKVSLDPMGGALDWSRTYGGTSTDWAQSVIQTGDGGYAVAGSTQSSGAGNWDFWLVKTNSAGTMQWSQTFGGANVDYAFSVVQTVDGGYALAGYTSSYGAGSADFWLVKTNSAGTMQWSQTYGGTGGDYCYSLVLTVDGGYALVGETYSSGAGSADFWLVKTNSAGVMQWSQTYGGTGEDSGFSAVQTSDGGYALAGYTYSFGAGNRDFWLIKTDGAGTLQWSKTYGGTGADGARSVILTGDGGYAIAGYTNSYGAGSYDSWLVRTDSSGNLQWNENYGGTGTDYCHSVVQTGDGGYALGGDTVSYGNGWQFWLGRTDAFGNLQWNRTYGGAGTDDGMCVIQTSDGGYAMTGYTNSFGAGDYDFWLVRVKGEMNVDHKKHFGGTGVIQGWSKTYGGTSSEEAHSVIHTSDGGYGVAGYTDSFGAGWLDAWLVKIDGAGNLQWDKTYGAAERDFAYSVVETSDGGYALAGLTYSYGAGGSDFWLVKTNSAGNMLWNRTYGGAYPDSGYSVVQTFDGGYALAGMTYLAIGNRDFMLVKTDASGNMQWIKTYGGTGDDEAWCLAQMMDGGYALAGYTTSFGAGSYDFWLVKTDVAGNLQWSRTYGGTGVDYGYSVIHTSDGGYAVAGYTNSFGGVDSWLVKTDVNGNALWSRTLGGSGVDIATSAVQTGDGGYALTGYTNSYSDSPSDYDFWLVKTDSGGNKQWSQTYGVWGSDYAYSVAETVGGGYAIAGLTASHGAGGSDFWLVKSDAELGLTQTGLANDAITLYRGSTDLYWNYVRVRIWTIQEPSWIYGDINMDGAVDNKDLYIIGRNYGKTFSLLSLTGIITVASIHTIKTRKQQKPHNKKPHQPNH